MGQAVDHRNDFVPLIVPGVSFNTCMTPSPGTPMFTAPNTPLQRPSSALRQNTVSRTKRNARLSAPFRRLVSYMDDDDLDDYPELFFDAMRFQRSAVYRDSRRRTAARFQKMRAEPNCAEVESDDDATRTVHFVARRESGRIRHNHRTQAMSSIEETVVQLHASPFRRPQADREPTTLPLSESPFVVRRKQGPSARSTPLRSLSAFPGSFDSALSSGEESVDHGERRESFCWTRDKAWQDTMDAPLAAIEATAAADQHDRDPLADGLILPETTQSRDMKIFKKILRDAGLREPFQTFLEQQFCAENLNFYVAVEQFRDLVMCKDSTYQDRAVLANRIFDRHFAQNSMEPVNVDNSTSRRIKETMAEKIYPRWTFDIAQYQIFHLLKYDCWPRFIRAGGAQPDFTDEELAEEDERIARLELLEDLPDLLAPRPPVDPADRPCTSASLLPLTPDKTKKLTEKEKRRSLLWHGFDRFSRKLRREPARSQGGSPITPRHPTVQRTSSSRAEDGRRSYSSEENDTTPVASRVVGSAGSKRRHMFASGKQYSMPAEMSNSPTPTRNVPKVESKHCRLMTGENCSTEIIELNDPTISVRAWTQNMATVLGMDKKATEVVDAETGSTIDPARQAIDALQSRSVRIVPVVTFAVEILPPNFSFKNPSSTPTKIIMVRARHSLSAGGVLRPLLQKYNIDLSVVVVTFCGTLETIRSSISIGNIGPRTLTVMSQPQFNDRQSGGKKDLPMPRDPIASSPNLAAEHNLQFHQHGDVSYCELPSEADRLKHAQQKEHPLSLIKFMRKASAAVTSKDDGSGRNKSSGRRKSVGQTTTAGVYCGEEHATPEPPKETVKKRLSIFKNFQKSKDKDGQGPSTSAEVRASPVVAPRESPRPQARDPCTSSSSSAPAPRPVVTPKPSNGDAPRTPAIFSSKVCAEDEATEPQDHGWQPAAYV